jgi:hypothetical protein
MVKSTALLLCLLLAFFGAHAQKYTIGGKAGVLLSWPTFADKEDKNVFGSRPRLGFSVAGLINFPMKEHYSFQAEGGFSRQGRTITYSAGTWKNECTYYFADMNMMLRRTFRLHLAKNIPTNWFLNIGPNINYWISSSGRIQVDPGVTQIFTGVFNQKPGPVYDKMYLNDVNRWLFGLNVGLGFNATTLRRQKIMTELRFTWAGTYLGKKNSATMNILGFEDNLKAGLNVINLSVGYVFDKDRQLSKTGKSTLKIKRNRK